MDMKISFSVRDRQRSVILTCRARSETAALVARRWPEYPTRVIPPSRYLSQLMVLCTLVALAGCASTKVQPSVMIPASDTLPRPTRIALGPSAGLRLVEEFETDAASSKKPGAAVGMGAGAAIGAGIAVSTAVQGGLQAVTEPKDTAEADAKRTAEQLAKQIKEIFA